MARGKDNPRKRAEEQARKSRNSAAHRSLLRRAQKGGNARSAQSSTGAEGLVDDTAHGGAVDGTGGEAYGHAVEPAPEHQGTHPGEHAAEPADTGYSPDELASDALHHDDPAVSERLPTGELTAPLWLAEGAGDSPEAPADAAAQGTESDQGATASAVSQDSAEGEVAVEDSPPAPARTPERSSVFATWPAVSNMDSRADETAVHAPVEDTAVWGAVGEDSDAPHGGQPATPDSADSSSTPPWAESPEAGASDGDGHGTRRKKSRAAWAVPLTLAGVAVLYIGAQALLSNTVPRGTEVLGLEIGSMSTAEATGAVADAGTAIEAEDLELRVAEETFALPASDAGLAIDADGTVAQVTGFTVAPDRLWAHVAGGGPISPVTAVDEAALADALEIVAVQLDGPAQDAGVTVADGAVEVVPGRASITVDQESSAARLVQAWPAAQAIDLIAETAPPTITDEDAAAFASELESQTFAAPITLVGEDAEATIEPATIASTSTVEAGPMGLELVVDGATLAEQIIADNPDLATDGENASVSFDDNHQIVIEEGSPGITIDGAALGDAVIAAAGSTDRIGELPYTAADPEVSAEDLGIADFQEIVASFDTALTAERIRTQNLRVAAADVAGVIVLPGETFDLTEALSPITAEEGYQSAGVIVNGILTSGMGGGLSQMATTVYNAGYFAGYEILDHRPHSVWLTRYPAGRESTIYTGSINVEFRNNTPYAAVFNSYLNGGKLYVDIWSTEHFEVTTAASPKTNVVQPGVRDVTSESCEAKGPGQPGFTITNTRTVSLDGEVVDTNSHTWTYQPDDAIRCVRDTPEDVDD